MTLNSVDKLHDDLRDDYIIQQKLPSAAGLLSLKCGRLMALASVVLRKVNHVEIPPTKPPQEAGRLGGDVVLMQFKPTLFSVIQSHRY